MAIDVYMYFNGNCREVVDFYAQVFETDKPRIMTYGEAPPSPEFVLPEEAKNLIMHAQLNIVGSNVMFSDVFPGSPFIAGNNISLTIVNNNIETIKVLFNKLKEGGKVSMELQETFWSKCYGSLKDKFGIDWQLSYDNG
ncbi:MAG: VOC family protein, partial [Gorillibacterium sp.]|nr:VOC family protein [Gorillibacterium sp.]